MGLKPLLWAWMALRLPGPLISSYKVEEGWGPGAALYNSQLARQYLLEYRGTDEGHKELFLKLL